MQIAEIETVSTDDVLNVSSFSSDLKSEIDIRASEERNAKRETARFVYTVGSYNILLEQGIKVENLAGVTINAIPHTPSWCMGMTNIRGIITPIVDMHVFLKTGIKNKESSKTQKMIMLEHKDYAPIIFQIDKLPELVFTDDYSSSKAPKNSPNWLEKTLENNESIIYKVNHDKLLSKLKHS